MKPTSPDDARLIRQIFAAETRRASLIRLLAHEFGVSRTTVWRILRSA